MIMIDYVKCNEKPRGQKTFKNFIYDFNPNMFFENNETFNKMKI